MPRTNPRIFRYEFSIDTIGELDHEVVDNIKKYMDNFSPVGKSYVGHYDVPIELTPLAGIRNEDLINRNFQPEYIPFEETDIGRQQAVPVATSPIGEGPGWAQVPDDENIPYRTI